MIPKYLDSVTSCISMASKWTCPLQFSKSTRVFSLLTRRCSAPAKSARQVSWVWRLDGLGAQSMTSSAYSAACSVRWVTLTASRLLVCVYMYSTTRSKYKPKSSGDMGHPCLTPVVVRNGCSPPGTYPQVSTNTQRIVSSMHASTPYVLERTSSKH